MSTERYFPVNKVLVKGDLQGSGVGPDKADRKGSIGWSVEVVSSIGAGGGKALGNYLFVPGMIKEQDHISVLVNFLLVSYFDTMIWLIKSLL